MSRAIGDARRLDSRRAARRLRVDDGNSVRSTAIGASTADRPAIGSLLAGMFSRRGRLHGARRYSQTFFRTFVDDLRSSGFNSIEVALPHNLVGLDKSVITVDDLLAKDRNFPSLILRAASTARNETLKVLFINRNSRAVFVDDTFPNAQSEPPQLFFQSPDPGRAYAVYHFFKEYLSSEDLLGLYFLSGLSMLGMLLLAAEALTIATKHVGFIASTWDASNFVDVALSVIAAWAIIRLFSRPRGLWIKPRRELRPFYLMNAALHGELTDNPLVSFVVSLAALIVGTVVLKALGVL